MATLAALAATAASSAGTIATVASAVGTGLSVVGALKQGAEQKARYNYEAKVAEQRADEERASGQRRAASVTRQGRIMQSDAAASAAMVGGGGDVSVLDMAGMTSAETSLAADTEMYRAEQRGRGLDDSAAVSRINARNAGTGGMLNAAGSLASGSATMFDRFAKMRDYNKEYG